MKRVLAIVVTAAVYSCAGFAWGWAYGMHHAVPTTPCPHVFAQSPAAESSPLLVGGVSHTCSGHSRTVAQPDRIAAQDLLVSYGQRRNHGRRSGDHAVVEGAVGGCTL